LEDVCTGLPLVKNISIGDSGWLTTFDEKYCNYLMLNDTGECINQVSFFGDQYTGILGMGYWTNTGNKGVIG
jgi:hypothetical protein